MFPSLEGLELEWSLVVTSLEGIKGCKGHPPVLKSKRSCHKWPLVESSLVNPCHTNTPKSDHGPSFLEHVHSRQK